VRLETAVNCALRDFPIAAAMTSAIAPVPTIPKPRRDICRVPLAPFDAEQAASSDRAAPSEVGFYVDASRGANGIGACYKPEVELPARLLFDADCRRKKGSAERPS
jgi:hypothetical protein